MPVTAMVTKNTTSETSSALSYDYDMTVESKTVAAGSTDNIVMVSGNWAASIGAYQIALVF